MKNMRKSFLALVMAIGAIAPLRTHASPPQTDILIKASGQSVYYYANNGKRYVFPNEKTYFSWFIDFYGIITVSDAELAAIQLGGNVTYRPGIRMIKIQSDPKVYAVDGGAKLRWVTTEALAVDLYGQNWNTAIDDVSDALFVNYAVSEPITTIDGFLPLKAAQAAETIDADKGINPGTSPRLSDSEVANVAAGWRAFALSSVNELRLQNGKGPLTENALMDRIATIHSRDMAFNIGQLSHDGSLGEAFSERIRFGKVPDVSARVFMTVPHPDGVRSAGENVGLRTTTAKQIDVDDGIQKLHVAFMDEPPDERNHRTNMLGVFSPFSQISIGVYVDAQNGLWLTEDFISQ